MQLLSIATLVVLIVKCIVASSDELTDFNEAVDDGDLAKAIELFQQEWELCDERADYVFETKSSKFIINFIELAKEIWVRLLSNLYEKATKEIIDEVLKKIEFSDEVLSHAASSPKLACSPKEFVGLLDRITTLEYQKEAVGNGITGLFDKGRTECIEPLLIALEGEESLNKNLHNFAIQTTFKRAASYHSKSLTEDLHDHPTITPVIYANALFKAMRRGLKSPVCKSLLSKADLGDLEVLDTIDDYQDYAKDNPKLDRLIKNTREVAKPAGTRLRGPFEKIKMTYQVLLDELPGASVPKVIIDIISSYVTKQVKVEVEGIKKTDEAGVAKKDKKRKKKEQGKGKESEEAWGEKWGELVKDF